MKHFPVSGILRCSPFFRGLFMGILCFGFLLPPTCGAATVISNQLDRKISVSVQVGREEPSDRELDSREVYPIHQSENVVLRFSVDGKPQVHRLENHALYYLSKGQNGKIGLFVFGLPEKTDKNQKKNNKIVPAAQKRNPVESTVAPGEMLTIPVKVLVDDEQPARKDFWERDLERCVEAASRVFEKTAKVQFKVIAAERWDSDDTITDFSEASKEFRREVRPQPALLAIGFSSQYRRVRGRVHFGSIQGPFCSHVLLRDWKQHMTPNERHELLAHELGHYLGATHSANPHSIMRPVITGNRPPNSLGYHPLWFDPINTLLINLYATELREQQRPNFRRPSFWRFDIPRKKQIRDIYAHMEKCFPSDDAAERLKEYVARTIPKPRKPRQNPQPKKPETATPPDTSDSSFIGAPQPQERIEQS